MVLSLALFIIFLLLSALHFYWGFGGKWGISKVVPAKQSGQVSFNPGVGGTMVVALGLLLFALFYLFMSAGYFLGWLNIFGWLIPVIFLLRAIGEFKYVGFFKRIVGTSFSKMDTLLFSPLCLLIALLGFWLKFTN